MEYTTIGAINEYCSETINPASYPGTIFEVYSVPSFESGSPEYLSGEEIGSTKQVVQKDDVLICKINPRINRVWVVANESDKKSIASSEWIVLRNREYNPEFLGWYFRSAKFKMLMISEVTGIGGSLTRAQPKRVAGYPVPLLNRSKQNEIVQRLNAIKRIIEARVRQIHILDTLIKARFVEMFGDPENNPFGLEKRLLSEIIVTANNGMARRGNDVDGSIVMRLVELQDGFIDYSAPNRITLNEAEKTRYRLIDNDFLFARVNGNPENVGRCAVFHEIREPVYHNDHIIRVHFNEAMLDGVFASALINSAYGKRQIKSKIKTSAGQYTISQDGIGAITTIIPPIQLQKHFAGFVSQIDKSKAVVQAALDKAQLLFNSLMQQYFG